LCCTCTVVVGGPSFDCIRLTVANLVLVQRCRLKARFAFSFLCIRCAKQLWSGPPLWQPVHSPFATRVFGAEEGLGLMRNSIHPVMGGGQIGRWKSNLSERLRRVSAHHQPNNLPITALARVLSRSKPRVTRRSSRKLLMYAGKLKMAKTRPEARAKATGKERLAHVRSARTAALSIR